MEYIDRCLDFVAVKGGQLTVLFDTSNRSQTESSNSPFQVCDITITDC